MSSTPSRSKKGKPKDLTPRKQLTLGSFCGKLCVSPGANPESLAEGAKEQVKSETKTPNLKIGDLSQSQQLQCIKSEGKSMQHIKTEEATPLQYAPELQCLKSTPTSIALNTTKDSPSKRKKSEDRILQQTTPKKCPPQFHWSSVIPVCDSSAREYNVPKGDDDKKKLSQVTRKLDFSEQISQKKDSPPIKDEENKDAFENNASSTKVKQQVKAKVEDIEEKEENLHYLDDLIGTEIPEHISLPKTVQVERRNDQNLVALGVETTSLNGSCEIVQLTCSDLITVRENDFSVHIAPQQQQIHRESSRVNGMIWRRGVLLENGRPVPTVPLEQGLLQLIDQLQENTILISHNTRCFQSHRLVRNALKAGVIDQLQSKVIGFSDSYALFLELYPLRQLGSYKLWNLIKRFSNGYEDPRFEAPVERTENMKKIQNLAQLLRHHNLTADENIQKLYDHSITIECVIEQVQYKDRTMANERTLQGLVTGNFLTRSMANRIASSGLTLHHLTLAYQRAGILGLFELLIPRITTRRSVIRDIYPYFLNE